MDDSPTGLYRVLRLAFSSPRCVAWSSGFPSSTVSYVHLRPVSYRRGERNRWRRIVFPERSPEQHGPASSINPSESSPGLRGARSSRQASGAKQAPTANTLLIRPPCLPCLHPHLSTAGCRNDSARDFVMDIPLARGRASMTVHPYAAAAVVRVHRAERRDHPEQIPPGHSPLRQHLNPTSSACSSNPERHPETHCVQRRRAHLHKPWYRKRRPRSRPNRRAELAHSSRKISCVVWAWTSRACSASSRTCRRRGVIPGSILDLVGSRFAQRRSRRADRRVGSTRRLGRQ